MEDATLRQFFKVIIAEAGLFMLFFGRLVKLDVIKQKGRIFFDVALVALALLSIGAYFEFGWKRYDQYMNPHDCYHYYMGAKYSQEHQYFDLYRTSLIADKEMRGVYTQSHIRNLDTHRYESVGAVIRDKGKYTERFTPERWEEFRKDILYWQSVMPVYKWNRVLKDKGYNATPVWNGVARFLTEMTPTNSVWGMRLLTYIDLVFLVAMFLMLWAAFGWRVMLIAIIFHGTNYFMAHVHIKGAILRLDWVAMLVVATCLIKMRWYKTAGGLMAYAGMARVFPMIFCFGLGAKAGWNGLAWLRDKYRKASQPTPLDQRYIAFFASFLIVCILLVAGSAFYDGGLHLWGNFFEKIGVHNKDISTTRAGFKYIFLWEAANKAAAFEEHKLLWQSIMALVLLITAFVSRKAEDYETIPLSFIPVFFLTSPTFYYYVMLVVPLLLFLPKIEAPERTIGGALLFLLSGAAFTTGFFLPHHFQFFFLLSCGMLILTLFMAFTVLVAPAATAVSPPEPKPKSSRDNSAALRKLLPFAAGLAAAAFVCVAAFAGYRLIAGEPEASKEECELVFVGDVMLSRNVARSVTTMNRPFSYPFERTASLLQEADLAFCNLESPISGRGERVEKNYTFNAPPRAIEGLTYAGFDVVSLANNHILDHGPVAMEDTIRHLEGKGIRQVGLCTNDGPQEPGIFERHGVRIAYLAYCDPVPKYSYAQEFYVFDKRPAKSTREALARDITALKEKANIIVVSLHWDIEYKLEPSKHSRELGRFIIDQGAHIVAGHHPHVLQDPEVYKKGLIIYSMGNFVFDQHSRPPTRKSRIYRVLVNKHGIAEADYMPCDIPKGIWQPTPSVESFIPLIGAPS